MVAPVGALPSMEPLLALLLTGLTCTVHYITLHYITVQYSKQYSTVQYWPHLVLPPGEPLVRRPGVAHHLCVGQPGLEIHYVQQLRKTIIA